MRARSVVAGVAVMLAATLVGVLGRAVFSRDGGGGGGRPHHTEPSGTAPRLPQPVSGSTAFDPAAAQAGSMRAGASMIATARATRVGVRASPGAEPVRSISARRQGYRRLPLVFSVIRRRRGWIKAYLPTRPNLSTGWIRASDVTLSVTPYRIVVQLGAHTLALYRRGTRVLRARIAKGAAVSPTPTGRYFITDLLRPPDPQGFYGPYAFGLSAHSSVYTTFEGGDGQVGIHGTNQPQVLGQDVSHGCIRVDNTTISRMAKLIPLGTPVQIARR